MSGFIRYVIAAVVASALCGCMTIDPSSETVEVKVKGVAATISSFDQALRPTLTGYVVGCQGCEQIGTIDEVTYSFFRAQTEVYTKFGTAWNAVVPPAGETKPGMTFYSNLVSADCNNKPVACFSLTPCIQFGRCTADSSRKSCRTCNP